MATKITKTTDNRSLDEDLRRLYAGLTQAQADLLALKKQNPANVTNPVQGPAGPPGPPGPPGTGLFYAASAVINAGDTINNTAAETPFTKTLTVPVTANLMVNSTLWIGLFGDYGIIVGAQSVRLRIKINGTTVLETGIIPISSGPFGPVGWMAEGFFTFSAVGAAGAAECHGIAQIAATNMTNDSVAIDTTQPLVFTFTWQFGAADPANTTTLRSAFIRQIG